MDTGLASGDSSAPTLAAPVQPQSGEPETSINTADTLQPASGQREAAPQPRRRISRRAWIAGGCTVAAVGVVVAVLLVAVPTGGARAKHDARPGGLAGAGGAGSGARAGHEHEAGLNDAKPDPARLHDANGSVGAASTVTAGTPTAAATPPRPATTQAPSTPQTPAPASARPPAQTANATTAAASTRPPAATTSPKPSPATYTLRTGSTGSPTFSSPHMVGPNTPRIGVGVAVQISCRVQGDAVADGDTWWYLITSSSWAGRYAPADNFDTGGTFVDTHVPLC